jgi:DNA-binding NarL/FixJ family response regulator
MLTIYLAEDSVIVRTKLKAALEECTAIKVIGEAGNAQQAIQEIRQLDPQVSIIDIRMPEGGGFPILQDIKARTPDRITMILTSFPSAQYRETYLSAGADYFWDKTKDIPQMIELLVKMTNPIGCEHGS